MRIVAGFSLLFWLGSNAILYPRDADRVRVFFPFLKLDSRAGEAITSLAIDVTCGRFRQLTIPDDWNLEVISPMSERTTLRASAGHGSSALRKAQDLDGIVAVSHDTPDCFNISAVVVTETENQQHRHAFAREQLRLLKMVTQ